MATPTITPHHHDGPYDSGFLQLGSIHNIYYTQYGNPKGKPAVSLHGGPGISSNIWSAQFFDPTVYRLVQFDQRGGGKSTPLGELRENDAQHLVSDIEALREHLGIDKWHLVFGGSWGSTLALLYAQTHPEMCGSLILRGVWLVSQKEFDLFFTLTEALWPEVYEKVFGQLTPTERTGSATVFAAFHRLLTTGDQTSQFEAAKLYTYWVMMTAALIPPPGGIETLANEDPTTLVASSRVNVHYMINKGFLRELQLLEPENIEKIQHIPTRIVNGRYDVLCPTSMAYAVHKALPKSELYIMEGAGHTSGDAPNKSKLIQLTNEIGKLDL